MRFVLFRLPVVFRISMAFCIVVCHQKQFAFRRIIFINPADDRKNKAGAGHPYKLNLKNRFLILMLYYRLYVSSTLIGFLFDLGQTNVLKDIRALEPAVQAILPLPKKIHDATRRLQTLEEVEAYFPGFKAFIDATEQEIPRPSAKEETF